MTPGNDTLDVTTNTAIHPVSDGVSAAIGDAVMVVDRTAAGLAAFRAAVRRAPVAMSLMLLGLGYLGGRILGSVDRVGR